MLAADWLVMIVRHPVDLAEWYNLPVFESLGFCQFFEYVQGPHVDFYHIFDEILYHKSRIQMVFIRNAQLRGFSNEKDS